MAPAPRPDPNAGVFETLLVVAGRPVELDAHLARLAAGLEALFEAELPREAGDLARERAAGIDIGRLRLTVAPGSAGLEVDAGAVEVDPALVFPSRERAVDLRCLLVEGGLGAHKWADRALLERAEAADPRAVPLLVDGDGAVLEASRANVFAVRGDALHTPPADGRILPGIARAAAIEVARERGIEVTEGRLTLADLRLADEAFLTGSVRGVEPVDSVDGVALPPVAAELSERIVAGLRRRWLG